MKHGNGLNRLLCILLAIALALGLASCSSLSKQERRIRKGAGVDLDLSGCRVEQETDTHGGFLGDGEYSCVADCPTDEIAEQIARNEHWHPLPAPELLQKLDRFSTTGNGYYYFRDRHSDATDPYDPSEVMNRYSFNYTLAVYDSDRRQLHCWVVDT